MWIVTPAGLAHNPVKAVNVAVRIVFLVTVKAYYGHVAD